MFWEKRNKKKKFFLKNIKIKIKDFETKPKVGGTPAKENNISMKDTVKNGRLPKYLKSFNVLKPFKLKTNSAVNKEKFRYK